MQTVTTIREMQQIVRAAKRGSGTIGLVPTMGALHEGHLSLVRAARARCTHVIATIFVNPLQFGPNEDFSRYPRTFERDAELLTSEGVDWLFAPSAEEMYPQGAQTTVDVPELGARLDGASRPGHFRGVATVVSKLFHITQPDLAFFGQKDAAQVAVLRRMVRDLNFPLEIVVCPTVREVDGLALSSRNRYLSEEERSRALVLSRALRKAEALAATGTPATLRDAMLSEFEGTDGVRVDYAAVVDPDTLLDVSDLSRGALLAVAAWVGSTRLIDNLLVPAREV
ncbi:pantoate--beta-alanine ligase [Terriglobus albidus]|uniref:Pantothenate synthetase n=1 Tax=Terriglobus albidus TaxID=1592106 RepID=A0A5B9ELD1_9BACT|nr:pantoate--beta-alanine ligase [Terriglobus albidus]QEE31201.1 pantoate--beta-alanine ligase [Terriglobus albidus]